MQSHRKEIRSEMNKMQNGFEDMVRDIVWDEVYSSQNELVKKISTFKSFMLSMVEKVDQLEEDIRNKNYGENYPKKKFY